MSVTSHIRQFHRSERAMNCTEWLLLLLLLIEPKPLCSTVHKYRRLMSLEAEILSMALSAQRLFAFFFLYLAAFCVANTIENRNDAIGIRATKEFHTFGVNLSNRFIDLAKRRETRPCEYTFTWHKIERVCRVCVYCWSINNAPHRQCKHCANIFSIPLLSNP